MLKLITRYENTVKHICKFDFYYKRVVKDALNRAATTNQVEKAFELPKENGFHIVCTVRGNIIAIEILNKIPAQDKAKYEKALCDLIVSIAA